MGVLGAVVVVWSGICHGMFPAVVRDCPASVGGEQTHDQGAASGYDSNLRMELAVKADSGWQMVARNAHRGDAALAAVFGECVIARNYATET